MPTAARIIGDRLSQRGIGGSRGQLTGVKAVRIAGLGQEPLRLVRIIGIRFNG